MSKSKIEWTDETWNPAGYWTVKNGIKFQEGSDGNCV